MLTILKDGEPQGPAAFMWDAGQPWVDVFAEGKSGEIERFGYSTEEKRWSYGSPPPHVAKQLKAEIKKTVQG